MAMIQQTPVLLCAQTEDEDIALSNYLTTKIQMNNHHQPQDIWAHQQQHHQHQQQAITDWSIQQAVYAQNGPYQYHNVYQTNPQTQIKPIPKPQSQSQRPPLSSAATSSSSTSSSSARRSRTPSNNSTLSVQVKKSTSTPITPTQRRERPPSSALSMRRDENFSQPQSSSPSSSSSTARRPRSTVMQDNRSYTSGPPSCYSAPSIAGSVTGSYAGSYAGSVASSSVAADHRRSSLTSLSSAASHVSIQSDAVTPKTSLSKRLRKVFSMNNMRSNGKHNSSDLGSLAASPPLSGHVTPSTSLDSVPENQSLNHHNEKNPSLRRRSLASLTSIFQKQAIPTKTVSASLPTTAASSNRRHSSGDLRQMVVESAEDRKIRPSLRVNTDQPQQLKRNAKVAVAVAVNSNSNSNRTGSVPDSPNSAMSSRSSLSRLPPPQRINSHDLPSPTPSSSSSSSRPRLPSLTKTQNRDDDESSNGVERPKLGIHYGLTMHGSPRLKPASYSSSSLGLSEQTPVVSRRRLVFCPTIQCHETFAASDYDRRCDNNATCQKLTPLLAMRIKQELNEYKLTDMEVHVDSRQYTHFFL